MGEKESGAEQLSSCLAPLRYRVWSATYLEHILYAELQCVDLLRVSLPPLLDLHVVVVQTQCDVLLLYIGSCEELRRRVIATSTGQQSNQYWSQSPLNMGSAETAIQVYIYVWGVSV